MKLATAPGTWGVEPPPQPTDPHWSRILDEIAQAGFDGSELGPLGYYPLDVEQLRAAFAARGLELPAGFVMEPLAVEDAAPLADVARRTCASVAGAGGSCIVLIDGLDPRRTATAGRSERAPRLDDAGWERLLGGVAAVRDVAREHGLAVAFHPHAGTWVEFGDEIDRLMGAVDADVGLCVDTGHTAYAGLDVVDLVERYAQRILHMHLKDLDTAALARVLADGATFQESVAAGVFRPLGEGSVDLPGVAKALRAHGYDGWATFEQDRVLATIDDALPESRRSCAYARAVGFGDEA
jgi:inosose dehydratase